MPGILLTRTSPVMTTLKENIHRVLGLYEGIYVSHYRRTSTTRDLYDDFNENNFAYLGDHLLRLSSQDYDTLFNGKIHLEPLVPIEVLLDPILDPPGNEWLEHDEVRFDIDKEETVINYRFELIRVRPSNKAGITIYLLADMAPVRQRRAG